MQTISPPKNKEVPPLRVLQAHSFYQKYLDDFYARHKGTDNKSHSEQMRLLVNDGFSAIHIMVPYLQNMGCDARLVVMNCKPAQLAWAQEHNLSIPENDSWEMHILRAQIEEYRPDVLYLLGDYLQYGAAFIKSLAFRPPCILGWRGADVPATIDLTGYHALLSGLPKLLAFAKTQGAREGIMFAPGMPTWIARAVQDIPQDTDVVFSGSISPAQHVHRLHLLQTIAEGAVQHGYSLALHVPGDPAQLPPVMRSYLRPPVFGLEMHKALRRGRIVIDDRAYHGIIMPDGSKKMDLGGGDTINMRLFEGTGGGSLVLTEELNGVSRYFEPGKEIATYRSSHHAVEQILHFLIYDEERTRISQAGQRRCLTEWNIKNSAKRFLGISQSALHLSVGSNACI